MSTPRPALTKRRRRMYLLIAAAVILGLATFLILRAFEDSLVFFYSPSEVATRTDIPQGRTIRIGGLVEAGSVERAGTEVRFTVTDGAAKLRVVYSGVLPDLFREGQGVVAQGMVGPGGTFTAREVLAKHDENYMPREVADALKKSGHWKEGEAYGKPATGTP